MNDAGCVATPLKGVMAFVAASHHGAGGDGGCATTRAERS